MKRLPRYSRVLLAILILMAFALIFTSCGLNDSDEPDTDISKVKKCTVMINTEGMGQISTAADGEKLEFSDDAPLQSSQVIVPAGTEIEIGAKADDGYKFVKWTLGGKTYSEDETIEITVSEDMEFTAVFGDE